MNRRRASIPTVRGCDGWPAGPAPSRFYSTPIGSSCLVLLTLPLHDDACGAVRERAKHRPDLYMRPPAASRVGTLRSLSFGRQHHGLVDPDLVATSVRAFMKAPGSALADRPWTDAFAQRLRGLGWIDGRWLPPRLAGVRIVRSAMVAG